MRLAPRPVVALLAALLAVGVSGCDLPKRTPAETVTTTQAADEPLAFAFQGINDEGLIDQTLTITNSSPHAKAPTLVITPLDADGAEVPDIKVQTAFGSDTGLVVVPANTQVVDILRFKGENAADVADVDVEVTDEGVLDEDVPPANDLVVQRFDRKGRPSDGRASSVSVENTYDRPVTVRIVGIEFAEAEKGQAQQFRRLTELDGPTTIEAGQTLEVDLPRKLGRRTFGSIKAYVSTP